MLTQYYRTNLLRRRAYSLRTWQACRKDRSLVDPGLNLDGHRMADAGAFERDLQMAADGAQPDDVTELRRAVDQLAIDRNDDVAQRSG